MTDTPVTEVKAVTLSQLRKPEEHLPVARMGFDSAAGFELMQRGARLLASSTLVPKDYQNNIPNCTIALNMAQRIGADVLQVMQNLYIVHGRPGWSAKYLIATFNQCGRFSPVRYEWQGAPGRDDWGCRAYATDREAGERVCGPWITIAIAKKEGWYSKNGSKWQTIPELMLQYRAAAWMTNTVAPEVSMGFSTVEELHDVYETEKGDDGVYQVTTESLRKAAEETPEKPAAARKSRKGSESPAEANKPVESLLPCDGPGCNNTFPEGSHEAKRSLPDGSVLFFCSDACDEKWSERNA